MSQKELARSIGMDVRLIDDIVRGDKPINAETALLLSRYFDTSAKLWTGLQVRYDLDVANDLIEAKLNAIKPRSVNGAGLAGLYDEQSPLDKCICGCGESPKSGSAFSEGYDQKALHHVIKTEYGSVSEFLQHHGYGPGG